jgi:hypothetical protein
MSETYRRFEILLPLKFNDGQSVPDELIADSLLELRREFGAVSCETQTIRGVWEHEGHIFRDDLVRIFVDTRDVDESRRFFAEFKKTLKARFRQLDIWVTTYPIELL